MGFGFFVVMFVFEMQWKVKLIQDEVVKFCVDVIEVGIWNDLGFGSNVDVVIIMLEKIIFKRNYIKLNERMQKFKSYVFLMGIMVVLNEKIMIRKQDIGNFVSIMDLMEVEVGDKMEVDIQVLG